MPFRDTFLEQSAFLDESSLRGIINRLWIRRIQAIHGTKRYKDYIEVLWEQGKRHLKSQ